MEASVRDLAPPLDWIAAGLEDSGWAAELCDAEWRLVWVSPQERALLGNATDEELCVGGHMLESRRSPFWNDLIDDLDRARWLDFNLPQILVDRPAEELVAIAPDFAERIESTEASSLSIWTDQFTVRRGDFAMEVRYFATRVRTPEGEPVGTVYLYGSSLPATLLTLVTAGNRAMFERMARLTAPGRRQAAVLFADVEASGALSRRLSSAAYFQLIRSLNTAMDALVIDRQGIVGKHAGDGVTAFFLADDLGSPSGAAFACLDTARALSAVARETAATTDQVRPSDLRLNVGAHWGSTLYMGQIVTGGRLEVSALGDEVNEGARLEQAAKGGEVLASKALVEQLSTADAAKLGLDVERAAYSAVADLPGVSDKVVRDAGSIAVTRIPA